MSRTSPSRAELDEIIRNLERVLLPQLKNYAAHLQTKEQNEQSQNRHQESYVQLAIAVLEEIGRPTPITVLLERIRERRNDPTITRGSVETSLLRHVNSKGEKAEMVKPSPGTYALRQHVAA
jgi:hypothetical protein